MNTRLARSVALVLAAPLAVVALTVVRPGPLPAPVLPPAFDGGVALTLTRELARDIPDRVPGSPGSQAAARWFEEKLALYGIPVEEDVWTQELPGLGTVELRNLAAVVRGTLDKTIVVIANRDNTGASSGANDNASGTAALVELARAYATVGTGGAQLRQPLHTIVFLSTDAGAYGSAGAERFAAGPRAATAVAALSLDGLAGRAPARIELGGAGRTSPKPALVRTLEARLLQDGTSPRMPDLLSQLVALALPLGLGEQAPLLAAGVSAVRLATAPEVGSEPGADEAESLSAITLARLGAAVDATIGSLDTDV
ncbi:MAG: M28 family peptidase, partial [Gaiella sp.]